MGITKVQSRGQITIPGEVRRQAGLRPGDTVRVEAVGAGELRVTLLPALGPRALRERFPIAGELDEPGDRAAWQTRAAGDVARVADA